MYLHWKVLVYTKCCVSLRVEVWGVNELWKVAAKVHSKCNKWMGCRTCAANVFSKAELGRGEVVAVTVKYWHQIACVDMEGGVKWRCEWQKLG